MSKRVEKIYNYLLQGYQQYSLNLGGNHLFYQDSESKRDNLSEITLELKDQYEKLKSILTENYGVIGGGIGLLDVNNKKPNLLFARKIKKAISIHNIDEEEIFDLDYPKFDKHKELVNLSFFAVRETQVPEYINLLNRKSLQNLKLKKKDFLEDSKFIWVTHEELLEAVNIYHETINFLFRKNKIVDFKSLKNYLRENGIEDTPTHYIVDVVSRLKDADLKEKIINSINYYIKSINELKCNCTEIDNPLEKIKNLNKKVHFPLLSYSFIYTFSGENANYSHVVFPLWNTFSEYHAYDTGYLAENRFEYSLVHGLFTIDNKIKVINEEMLIQFKLILRQLIEPIIDKEHYYKIKENDLKEIKKHFHRNIKLDLAAYNISHTYASHIYPFIERYIDDIQERIYDLYDQILNDPLEEPKTLEQKLKWFKDYHKEQVEKFTRLAINLSAANDRFNKPLDKMFYTNYEAGFLFNEKLASDNFSKLTDGFISHENGMSLGITDGDASCVLQQRINKRIKLSIPYGEIGVTMLMMLITNLFRNLKKHSSSDKSIKYRNDVNNLRFVENIFELNNITEQPENYHFRVEVKPIELSAGASKLESRFRDNYVKVTFIEKSRKYHRNEAIKFDGKEVNVTDLAKELTSRFDDWSEEHMEDWKGLKEIRMIASVLIGCPVEEIDFMKQGDYFVHGNDVFPKQMVVYEAVPLVNEEYYEMHHSIYLRKAKFCTVWLNQKDYGTLEKDTLNHWKNNGVEVKVKGIDKPNPLASVSFIIDCNSGQFDNIIAPTKHFNFRFVKTDFCDIKNKDSIELESKIKKLWITENSFLKAIDFCASTVKGKKSTVFGNETNFNGIAIIDNHFEYLKSFDGSGNEFQNYAYKECDRSKCLNELMAEKSDELEYLQREAVNTKVVIYDEVFLGLIENTKDKVWTDIDLETSLNWKNIYVTKNLGGKGKDENLKQTFSGEGKDDLDDLIDHIKFNHSDHKSKVTYILLHYSGFEKLYKGNIRSFNNYLPKGSVGFEELSERTKFAVAYNYLIDKVECKRRATYVVLCSGKYPNLLPNNAYFTDRESLKYYILNISSKISLVNHLSGLRIQKFATNEKDSNSN